jgi:hypothetical protein
MAGTVGYCGTGLGNFPAPGDPNLTDSILTAIAGFKGIALHWSYPGLLPHAVAHTRIYRSLVNDWTQSYQLTTAAGSYHFDNQGIEVGVKYYYWIKMVSVNGTVGDLIGPASAIGADSIEAIIEELEGRINESVLSQELRTRIDLITDISSAISDEEQTRILGEAIFTELMNQYKDQIEGQGTLILQEINERQTANSSMVQQANLIRAETEGNFAAILTNAKVSSDADSALAARVDFMIARVDDNAAAILVEEGVRADKDGAAALKVETLQATVGEVSSSLQTYQKVVNDINLGLSATYMVKTDVDGYVSGFGLYNDGNHSDFLVHADTFAIGKPLDDFNVDVKENIVYPFIIADVNGETVIALNAKTLIPDAHITNAMISDTIQSDDYDFFTTGWGIHKTTDNGNGPSLAVFHNLWARGNIEASSIKVGSANIVDTLMLQGNSVTVPANVASTGQVSVGTSWQNVSSIYVNFGTVAPGKVIAFADCQFLETDGGNDTRQLYARIRNSSGQFTEMFINETQGKNTMISMSASFGNPGAGGETYYLDVKSSVSAKWNTSTRHLTVMGAKR